MLRIDYKTKTVTITGKKISLDKYTKEVIRKLENLGYSVKLIIKGV